MQQNWHFEIILIWISRWYISYSISQSDQFNWDVAFLWRHYCKNNVRGQRNRSLPESLQSSRHQLRQPLSLQCKNLSRSWNTHNVSALSPLHYVILELFRVTQYTWMLSHHAPRIKLNSSKKWAGKMVSFEAIAKKNQQAL